MATPTTAKSASTTPSSQDPIPQNENLARTRDRFKNFDDVATYDSLSQEAVHKDTKNFVVQFGVHNAEIAMDLCADDFTALFDTKPKKNMPVRWINIWDPDANKEEVKRIASHYEFSTRLIGTIFAWNQAKQLVAARAVEKKNKTEHAGLRQRIRYIHSRDPELGLGESSRPSRTPPEDIAMFELLQRTLNYTTIDHGKGFVCIGANWLHNRPSLPKQDKREDDPKSTPDIVPPSHWAWYILTHDFTVISIQEAPQYNGPEGGNVLEWNAMELTNMRMNTFHLLQQLTDPGMKKYAFKIVSTKGVRSDLQPRDQHGSLPKAMNTLPESLIPHELSSNLFYYLFEDYSAGVTILNASHEILGRLTKEVIGITDRHNKDKDTSDTIRTLYDLSKEFRKLRHLFKSYEKVFQDIMAIGKEDTEDTNHSIPDLRPQRDVKLSQKAWERFDRLNARLKLLMLNTIDEYLDEKTALSDTYFNLIAQKDSQATSRLTRSATLLAKLSVFFLPISFMTSYFSVQIPDLTGGYTASTYWVAFAVIATLSFISLFFFSRLLMLLSDVLDEKIKSFEKWSLNRFKENRAKKGAGEDHPKVS